MQVASAMAVACEATQAEYAAWGFDPQAFIAGLGIEADFGNYVEIAQGKNR